MLRLSTWYPTAPGTAGHHSCTAWFPLMKVGVGGASADALGVVAIGSDGALVPDRYYRVDLDFSYKLLAYPLEEIRFGYTRLEGIVPNSDRRVPADCTPATEGSAALPLPARQLMALVEPAPKHGVHALRQFGHHLVGAAALGRVKQAILVVEPVDLAEADILLGRKLVAHKVLEDHADALAQLVGVILAQVDAVEQLRQRVLALQAAIADVAVAEVRVATLTELASDAEGLAQLPKDDRRKMLLAYLGYPFYDIATLPLLQGEGFDEFDPIKVDRISPSDATAIRTGGAGAMLKGIEFNSFGAFFSRAYRENDYLWGRLHGADRLVDIVASSVAGALSAEELAAIKRRAFHAILDEEEGRLPQVKALIDELRVEIG